MTIFVVETYVVKPEKLSEFTAYKEKWKKFFAKWLKEVKSYKMFIQLFGGNWGGYVEMWEFENLADCEKFFNRVMQSNYTKELYPEFASLVVPATYSISAGNPVE
jgi:hypothetical protein